MFGNNNKKDANKPKGTSYNTVAINPNAFNSLVQGAIVEGTVRSESDIRIDGAIKGKLFCDAKVVIGPSGRVEGEVRCANAVIEGAFEGTIVVADLLHIRENANISGDVTTNKLIVQSGATFNVTCNMGGQVKGNSQSAPTTKKEEDKGVKAPTANL
jgi:cytoskeletal protein CcmA (bactofilin family)